MAKKELKPFDHTALETEARKLRAEYLAGFFKLGRR